MLGFRATSDPGATQDYVVNLGPVSQFTQTTSAFAVPGLGNILTDLEATFGTSWKTRTEVLWGGVATDFAGDPANTLYATRPRADVAIPATAWTRRSNSGQGTTNSIFRAFFSGYTLSDANAASPKGTIQSKSFTNSYASFTSPNVDFGFFNGIEGNFAGGTAGTVLDLFRLTPTQQPAGQVFVGSFQLNDSGVLTFTPTVPTAPTFRFDSATYSVNEDVASGNVTIRVVRGGLTTGADTVQFDTSDDTALAGADYTARTAFSVTFAANETQADVMVAIVNRDGFQGNRNFSATLSNPTSGGALVSPTTATVTINESSPQNFGQIAFSAATYQFAPVSNLAQPNSLAITLNRTNGTDGAVTVDVAVSGGSLTNGTDFNTVASPTTVSFAAGETSKIFNIQLKTIAGTRLPGTINLGLSNATGGATLGATTTAIVTVTAADRVRPTFTLSSVSGAIVTTPTFQVVGLARDNKGIDRVEVQVNGGAPHTSHARGIREW